MKLFNSTYLLKFTLLFASFAILSCSKDSEDTPEASDITVTTSNFSVTIDENPSEGQVIGTVAGTTNQGTVTFSITEQTPSGAFTIDAASGELKVANEALFDFETNPTISGTVNVANGAISENALVTISISDISEENIYQGDVILRTQTEVDEFGTHNYTGITGYLLIGHDSGTTYSNITNLSPLQALTFVGNYVTISYNGELQTLSGLENLSEIGGTLAIVVNPALLTLENLGEITEINDSLMLHLNPLLTNLQGLESITTIASYLSIQVTPLVDLNGLQNITSVGTLQISGNENIENITALSGVVSIQDEIIIDNNPNLTSLTPLENVEGNIRRIYINYNNSLFSLNGLENISCYGQLDIFSNNSLTDLSGLEKITNINTHVRIENNENLISLHGLENLVEVSVQVSIWDNSNLTNYCALENLCISGSVGYFGAHNNAYNPTKQDIIDGNCSI
ncbi:cadherin repeat domain-containing protein [Ulvibacter litoralis]|uniref:Cadherin domain-containing protein n=1 Tax=Ulvibacter litoralis TaxID=227084 RepID=A0A1G7EKS9_9FLAO|nr:cadherin repeat domain-containing protein [Ulvibacter litoralis]GHC54758.1 hypothetical protein GCM10008083_18850 [Ulvibacter litoralis]SDE64035.1 hypothetical protein SAMN05421855_10215 [Ulvibacter litoralis]